MPIRLVKEIVFVGQPSGYVRTVTEGIAAYSNAISSWSLRVADAGDLESVGDFDGVISITDLAWTNDQVALTGVPTINISSASPPGAIPTVVPDNDRVGELAAQHLLDRRLRHFGFVGARGATYAEDRLAGFARTCMAAGCAADQLMLTTGSNYRLSNSNLNRLEAWLQRLPRPSGVLAMTDSWAADVLRLCRRLAIRVPEDLAIIGVDNEEAITAVVQPPLTSIKPDGYRVGYTAATWLDHLMHGRPLPQHVLRIPPLGIVARRSTDLLHVADEAVARAWQFIIARVDQPIGIDDVCEHVALARRTLERRFHIALGITLGKAIRRAKIDQACHLLTTSPLSIDQIAAACGYRHVEHLFAAFKTQTGQTPGAYRATRLGLPMDGRSRKR